MMMMMLMMIVTMLLMLLIVDDDTFRHYWRGRGEADYMGRFCLYEHCPLCHAGGTGPTEM